MEWQYDGRLGEHRYRLSEALARYNSTPSRPTPHRRFDLETDLVNLEGKVAIVTGGNRGKGLAVVRHLLRERCGRVYLAARNELRAAEAIQSLHEEGLGLGGETLSEVVWMYLDLSDPVETKRAAEEFMRREGRLNILINNAGDMFTNEIGRYGVSTIQIVNYISPYVFTQTLLPLLTRTAQGPDSDVRIVNVASKVYRLASPYQEYKRIDDFNSVVSFCKLSNLHQYGTAKLATILWSRHLQAQLTPSPLFLPNGITVLTLHPGTSSPPFTIGLDKAIRNFHASTPEVGAMTIMFAAAARKVWVERERYQASGGVYLVETPVPGSVQELGELARDEKLGRSLVQVTERFLREIGI